MSHATISRSLKTLKDKGLVSVLQVDFKQGNVWSVSPLAVGNPNGDDPPPKKKPPQTEGPQIANEAASNKGNQSLDLRQLVPQNELDLRSFKKVKKLKEVARPIVQLPEPEADDQSGNAEDMLKSFEAELDGQEQVKLVNEFMAREYPHGFFPPMRVIRTLAAREWFGNGSGMRSMAC